MIKDYKSSVHQEHIIILNNNRAPKYIRYKLTELQRKIDKTTIIAEDNNIPLTITDRTNRPRKSIKIWKTPRTLSINLN